MAKSFCRERLTNSFNSSVAWGRDRRYDSAPEPVRMNTSTITVAQSEAFVATFEVSPSGSGPLNRLCFAVNVIQLSLWFWSQ